MSGISQTEQIKRLKVQLEESKEENTELQTANTEQVKELAEAKKTKGTGDKSPEHLQAGGDPSVDEGVTDLEKLVEAQKKQDLKRDNGPSDRPSRTPIGSRNILTAPQRAGYKRRFVLNNEGRVPQFQEHGYKIVTGDVQVGDAGVHSETKVGSAVTANAGNGKRHVLMEIKEEWYNEDQASKQKEITKNEHGMFEKAKSDADYGSVRIE